MSSIQNNEQTELKSVSLFEIVRNDHELLCVVKNDQERAIWTS